MALLNKEDLEKESGSKFIPDSVLKMLDVDILRGASREYTKTVQNHPEFEFKMVYDQTAGGLSIYWTRVT